MKILVVEDDAYLREALCEELELSEYGEIYSAPDVAEATAILEIHEINLIISDIQMPNEDGVSFLNKVRAKYKNQIIFILMSGYSDLLGSQDIQTKADALLKKPFRGDELVKILDNLKCA